MHIHLSENPARNTNCDIPKQTPMISLDTIQECSHMDATMAEVWLNSLENFQPHVCDGVRYIPGHRVLSWLTLENHPPMPMDQAINLITAKTGPYLDPHVSHNLSRAQIRATLAKMFRIDAVLNDPCGTQIPIDGLFNFPLPPKASPGRVQPYTTA